jgi:uncharacterized protein
MAKARFEWDPDKDKENQDLSQSIEKRYCCFGGVGGGILVVRFTYRAEVIRIYGSGHWRKGKRIYERENSVRRRAPRRPRGRS